MKALDNTSWTTKPSWLLTSRATPLLTEWPQSAKRSSTHMGPSPDQGPWMDLQDPLLSLSRQPSLICHRGPNREAGHYFAILIYRDLMWLADDGKAPMHLPHLTPQLASQVIQIWAVHIDTFSTTQEVIQRLPLPEEPDFDPPLHPSPEKRPRLEQNHCRIHYANITHFGRQVLDWYWTRESEPYIMVETHLDPQQHEQMCQYFTVRGRTAFGVPAWPNSDNSGTHGGILIIGDPSSGLEAYDHQGCGYQAFLWQATEQTILLAGVYLRTNEGIQSETNATPSSPGCLRSSRPPATHAIRQRH